MKAIKCEMHEPYEDYVKITYYNSIRKALKYCKANNISRRCIWIKYGEVYKMVFGNGICF